MPHAGGASTLLCISLGRREAKLCKKHITGTSPGFASFTRLIGEKSENNKVLELAIDKSVQVSLKCNGWELRSQLAEPLLVGGEYLRWTGAAMGPYPLGRHWYECAIATTTQWRETVLTREVACGYNENSIIIIEIMHFYSPTSGKHALEWFFVCAQVRW